MNRLLVVEDDEGLRQQLKWAFDGVEVILTEDRKNAITEFKRHEPQVVLLDLGLPPDAGGATEGFATLKEILALNSNTKVIVVTGLEDKTNALTAIGLGAFDFYQKPVDPDVLQVLVDRAFGVAELVVEIRLSRKAANSRFGIVGCSPEIERVITLIDKVARTDISCLIFGETGSGKELVAKALHQGSERAEAPFVAINCAAIPENLLESELFGFEKGAFTGAVKSSPGKMVQANGGTLFLDEIGDMPLALQAKLLRFLQERTVEPLGAKKAVPVDVRVVCATHRDLETMVATGEFRQDLFYRLNEINIDIPPLRSRQGDIEVLAHHLLNEYAPKLIGKNLSYSEAALDSLKNHSWQGNVRELISRIKRAVVLSNGITIEPGDLQLKLDLKAEPEPDLPVNLKTVREQAESTAIRRAMTIANGNISETAKLLGVTRPTLYSLMDKYHIERA